MKKRMEELKYKNEIWKKIQNSKYEISNYGRFRRYYKYKYRYLKTFRKGSIQVIKLTINNTAKDYNVAKIVVESFIRTLKKREVVFHKNGITSDNRIWNLEIISRNESGRRTGWQSKRKAIAQIDNEGNVIRFFKGTREAAKTLFVSKQTISDYCNSKVSKPMYNLIWCDKLIEKSSKTMKKHDEEN